MSGGQIAQIRIAKKLKYLGVNPEIISKATGLKIYAIEQLSCDSEGKRRPSNFQGNGFNPSVSMPQIPLPPQREVHAGDKTLMPQYRLFSDNQREEAEDKTDASYEPAPSQPQQQNNNSYEQNNPNVSKVPISIEDEECPEDFIIDYPKGNANPFTYPKDDDSCYFLYLTNRKKAFSKLTSIKPNPLGDHLPPEFRMGYTNLHIYKRCCLWYKGICHFNAYDESESEYWLYYFILYRDKDGVLQKKYGRGTDYKEVLEQVHSMTKQGYYVYSCIGAIMIESFTWH